MVKLGLMRRTGILQKYESWVIVIEAIDIITQAYVDMVDDKST